MKTLSQKITENMKKVKTSLDKASEHINEAKRIATIHKERKLASNRLN
jgi:hypothetical protein